MQPHVWELGAPAVARGSGAGAGVAADRCSISATSGPRQPRRGRLRPRRPNGEAHVRLGPSGETARAAGWWRCRTARARRRRGRRSGRAGRKRRGTSRLRCPRRVAGAGHAVVVDPWPMAIEDHGERWRFGVRLRNHRRVGGAQGGCHACTWPNSARRFVAIRTWTMPRDRRRADPIGPPLEMKVATFRVAGETALRSGVARLPDDLRDRSQLRRAHRNACQGR